MKKPHRKASRRPGRQAVQAREIGRLMGQLHRARDDAKKLERDYMMLAAWVQHWDGRIADELGELSAFRPIIPAYKLKPREVIDRLSIFSNARGSVIEGHPRTSEIVTNVLIERIHRFMTKVSDDPVTLSRRIMFYVKDHMNMDLGFAVSEHQMKMARNDPAFLAMMAEDIAGKFVRAWEQNGG